MYCVFDETGLAALEDVVVAQPLQLPDSGAFPVAAHRDVDLGPAQLRQLDGRLSHRAGAGVDQHALALTDAAHVVKGVDDGETRPIFPTIELSAPDSLVSDYGRVTRRLLVSPTVPEREREGIIDDSPCWAPGCSVERVLVGVWWV